MAAQADTIRAIRNQLRDQHGMGPVVDMLNVAARRQRHLPSTTHQMIVRAFEEGGVQLHVTHDKEIEFPDEATRQLIATVFDERDVH
jgi:hypothetical protein